MEERINIAEILKNKPKRTKLYADAFGELSIEDIYTEDKEDKDELGITLSSKDEDELLFYNDGKYNKYGEPILVPSKSMHDWRKFSWKKGDVLQNNDHNTQVIFDRFISDTYEMVRCKYWLKVDNGIERFVVETNVFTKDYFKVSEELSQCYINEIENRCGGKLNLETLEIEKQTEFKDGDIVFEEGNRNYCSAIGVLKKDEQGCFMFDTFLTKDKVCYNSEYIYLPIRLATEEEKQQLFSALKKEGKAWDSDKKAIVDLKPKVELKPFDKVLVRDFSRDKWSISFFSFKKEDFYVCINHCSWNQCIPYIGNESLLGTTKDVED